MRQAWRSLNGSSPSPRRPASWCRRTPHPGSRCPRQDGGPVFGPVVSFGISGPLTELLGGPLPTGSRRWASELSRRWSADQGRPDPVQLPRQRDRRRRPGRAAGAPGAQLQHDIPAGRLARPRAGTRRSRGPHGAHGVRAHRTIADPRSDSFVRRSPIGRHSPLARSARMSARSAIWLASLACPPRSAIWLASLACPPRYKPWSSSLTRPRALARSSCRQVRGRTPPRCLTVGPWPSHPVGPTYERFTLPNGLRVVLTPDRARRWSAWRWSTTWASGPSREGRTGFAHLFEHLMFQGSANLEKLAHFRHVQGAGGTFNGSTHLDYTDYFETLPSNALERALFLEADRMRGPPDRGEPAQPGRRGQGGDPGQRAQPAVRRVPVAASCRR